MEIINNIFTSSVRPDTMTMSAFYRPSTSQNIEVSGLFPSKSAISLHNREGLKTSSKKHRELALSPDPIR